MTITKTPVEEVTCDVCGHVWIVRDGNYECPECKRRSSEITETRKNRHLCTSCHHVWMTDSLSFDTFCPKCGQANEENKKVITYDPVSVYTCGACDNEWVKDIFNPQWDTDLSGNTYFVHEAIYCKKCGCGKEEALETKRKKDEQSRRRQTHGYTYTSYRGHTQVTDPDTGLLTPSKEEIDARIAVGIWKDESRNYQVWNATV